MKRPDKTPCKYDHTPFALDAHIEMDLTFDDKTIHTLVYIKSDAHDQLLLSQRVCAGSLVPFSITRLLNHVEEGRNNTDSGSEKYTALPHCHFTVLRSSFGSGPYHTCQVDTISKITSTSGSCTVEWS